MKVTGAVLKKRQQYKAKGDAGTECLATGQHLWHVQAYITCTVLLVLSLFLVGVQEEHLTRLHKVKRSELPAEHQISGKPSHHASLIWKLSFLNSMMLLIMDHIVGSSSPKYYFDAMFSSLWQCTSNNKDQTYGTKVRHSVAGCFNLAQKANDHPTGGNTSAQEWLKKKPLFAHRRQTVTCARSTMRRSTAERPWCMRAASSFWHPTRWLLKGALINTNVITKSTSQIGEEFKSCWLWKTLTIRHAGIGWPERQF